MSGRHRTATSYGHTIRLIGPGSYRLAWTVDRYVAGSRLRHPVGYQRIADREGAIRFGKKWGIPMPQNTTEK